MLSSLIHLALLTTAGDPPEWGGFRGNNGAGLAENASLPESLDPEDRLWRVETPAGYSSPIIAGDRVFLTAARRSQLLTLCIDRADGSVLWERKVDFDGKRPGANSPAAPSPVTDGEFVYCLFHHFGLIVYDVEGEEVWSREFGPFSVPHGMSSSPVLHEDTLILQLDQDTGSSLLALDKFDGEELWTTERRGFTHSYSTPAIHDPEEGPAQVVVSGAFKVSGYSLVDGEQLWWVEGSAFMTKAIPQIVGDRCIVSAYAGPISEAGLPKITKAFEQALEERDEDGDGLIGQDEFDHPMLKQAWFVFDLDDDGKFGEKDWDYLRASSRPTGGLFSIRLDGRGDVSDTHVDWKYDGRRGIPDCTSPVIVGDHAYMVKAGGLMSTFDLKNGEMVKHERVGEPDRYYASPISANGKIVTVSLSGQLAVISATADWDVLSVNSLEEEVWSTPALAGNQLFVRSQTALWCFDTSSDGE